MKRGIATLLAIILMTTQIQLNTIASEPQSSAAVLTSEATTFSVTLPTTLPIDIDTNNVVTVATDVTLQNNSTGPIKVNSIDIIPINGWQKVTLPSDKVDTKEFRMEVNVLDESIPAKQSSSIVYSALVSPQKAATQETIAEVIFTVGWDTAYKVSTELIETNPSESAFNPGKTKELTFKFENATSDSVAWTSSNESIATVIESPNKVDLMTGEQRAIVQAISTGRVIITASLEDGSSSSINLDIHSPVIDGEKSENGNYTYTYHESLGGWAAKVIDNTQTSYTQPLEQVKGIPVVSYGALFQNYSNSELTLEGTWTNKNVVDMGNMFSGVKAVTLDLSNFNTDAVEYMSSMFLYCNATTLDLSNFNTSNVKNMDSMFLDSKANKIVLSSFKTSKVTDMSYMFKNSQALVLDISHFDTGNVESMDGMFNGSSSKSLDISQFKTDKVTSMAEMFSGCPAEVLDIANFDTSNVTNMASMFYNSGVLELNLDNFDTNKVTDMSRMFSGTGITELSLSSFNTSNVINMSGMFEGSQAAVLDLSSFDTSNLKYKQNMFSGAKATTGYARTQADATSLNNYTSRPQTLYFIVK